MGELGELTGAMRALKNVKEVELMGMPKLKKCVLMGGLKNVKSVKMENAGKFESVKVLKEAMEAERKRREEMMALAKANVSVRNVGDLQNVDISVQVIAVTSYSCNDSELSVLDLSQFVNLRELKVGYDCFANVKDVSMTWLKKLEKVEFGKNCCCQAAGGSFEVKECERLKSVKTGDGCFVKVRVVVFMGESLLALL